MDIDDTRSNMVIHCLIVLVCLLFCVCRSAAGTRGVDLGMCSDDHLKCPCGPQSSARMFKVDISIIRCSYFHRYKMFCKPCTPYRVPEVCRRFRLCDTCTGGQEGGCLTCPHNRYGRFCENECSCQNGGTCDPDGSCVCLPHYNGTRCEQSTACGCLHGGSCLPDQTCVCLPEYEGPQCERRKRASCGPPSVFGHVRVNADSLMEGGVATFSCPSSYVLVGHATITCQPSGRWSAPSPVCEFQCVVPEPRAHQVVEVIPTLIHTNGAATVELVRELQLSCRDGYVIDGASNLRCLPTGIWNTEVPECVRTCNEPRHIQYGRYRGDNFLEGASVVYKCDEGYRMIGASTVLCLDGQWRVESPRCERRLECLPPRTIAHGVVLSNDTTHPVGSSLRYVCEEGFRLEGADATRTCTDTGNWSSPEPWCERDILFNGRTCSTPEVPVHGSIKNLNYVQAFAEDVRLLYGCDEGYILVGNRDRTCTGNGTWSGDLPRCVKVITCDEPGIPSNAHRQVVVPELRNSRGSRLPDILRSGFDSPDNDQNTDFTLPEGKFRVYTRLNFQCESHFYRQVGSRRRRCRRDGRWSGRQPACLPICGKSATARLPLVYNGTVSGIGQWPWQAAISRHLQNDFWYITCGASLVSERLVVTAAHCVTHYQTDIPISVDDIAIYLGKHYRSDVLNSTFVQKRKVTSIEVHPHYDPGTYDLDIAVLWLDTPVTLTPYVRPVCLPSQFVSERHLRPGTEGVVTGWGVTENSRNSEELRMAKVQTTTNADCMDKYAQVGYPQTITESMFCAGQEDGSSDACEGDSGGPLVFPGTGDDRNWYLEGVVSWGSPLGCGIELQYGVYTKVSHCLDWLANFV
ncbi:limulus clotting factor C-like isoform X1 [Mizuhopecten yessoensis]|uniref:limulus clotting factor C-like isoform X1 n=1 Tax=Mizuhopecten yessoensis TaxID=6573 RepID=UPI000B45B35D|nr:limulus clotting factor C-like isoform X1 [Mizuhopecten yessoensis]